MTQIAIQAQVDSIVKATEKAAKSKEAAKKFLVDAGIIEDSNTRKKTTTHKNIVKK
ncbi:MAG TPA: hypothetical protein VHD83_19295 [Puia sp.]|nr:hypothetical protein [Puia sp.]